MLQETDFRKSSRFYFFLSDKLSTGSNGRLTVRTLAVKLKA